MKFPAKQNWILVVDKTTKHLSSCWKKLEIKRLGLWFICLCGISTTLSCSSPTQLSKEELTKYIFNKHNGLYKPKLINGTLVSVYYKPTGLMVAQEANDQTDANGLVELTKKYNPYTYFILDLARDKKNPLYGSGSIGAFGQNLQTLAFKMHEYVNITTSKLDTIPLIDFVYPRMYGISKSTSIMLAFDNQKLKDAKWVSVNVNEFGLRTGDQQFRFSVDEMLKAPNLGLAPKQL